MVDRTRINEGLTVGNVHPDAEQLAQLAGEGFQTVVNLRTEGERNQPLTPEEERHEVERLGMHYLHYPVTNVGLSDDVVDAFRERIGALPRPLFVHCASGMRSGAFVMMHVAAEACLRGETTLEKANAMGLACDQPALAEFVKRYVDQHCKPG